MSSFYQIAFWVVVTIAVYVWLVRPFLVHMAVLSPMFKAEASYFTQLRAKIAGWKTKLTARFVVLAGVLVSLHDMALPFITGQDWTTITSKVPQGAWPFIMVVVGVVFSYLRKVTENPPQVITQRMEDGSVQVVGFNKPGE